MPKQLLMTWPPDHGIPEISVPEGYILRNYRQGDDDAYVSLMRLAGFETWSAVELERVKELAVPDGIFFIEYAATGVLAATAFGQSKPTDIFTAGAELGWVAGDPSHAGKGLGMAVCTAVLRRLWKLGYQEIYLLTDDFRLPAIKTYLKLGFVPVHHDADMPGRWEAVFISLGMDGMDYPPVTR